MSLLKHFIYFQMFVYSVQELDKQINNDEEENKLAEEAHIDTKPPPGSKTRTREQLVNTIGLSDLYALAYIWGTFQQKRLKIQSNI